MMRKASAILACLLLFVAVGRAQETRGSIEGVVKDSSGAVLPGVTVEARNAQGGVVSSVSDAQPASAASRIWWSVTPLQMQTYMACVSDRKRE